MSERTSSLSRKSIIDPIENTDGIRILTVSRKTGNDGETPSSLFYDGSYDYWQKELSPPPTLVGAWYRGEVTKEEFETYYKLSLLLPGRKEMVLALKELAKQTKVTVLCVCTTGYCHTKTLLEICSE